MVDGRGVISRLRASGDLGRIEEVANATYLETMHAYSIACESIYYT